MSLKKLAQGSRSIVACENRAWTVYVENRAQTLYTTELRLSHDLSISYL